MMLVFSGLVDEGMAYLEQALAAICSSSVRELPVVEGCLRGLLNACERAHDVDRVEQRLDAAQDVMRRGNLSAVAGYCRAPPRPMLGWDRAELAARTAHVRDALAARLAQRGSPRTRRLERAAGKKWACAPADAGERANASRLSASISPSW
jgi:hypothetical protein